VDTLLAGRAMGIRRNQDPLSRSSFSFKSPIIPSPKDAFRRLLLQTILLSVIAPLAFLGLIGWRFYALNQASKEMLLAEQRMTQITALQTAFLKMQSSVRGYLLIRNEDFLDYYRNTVPTVEPALTNISQTIEKDSRQGELLAELKDNLKNWISSSEGFISFRKKHSDGLPTNFLQTKGLATKNLELLKELNELQTKDTSEAVSHYLQQRTFFLFFFVGSTLFVALIAIFINQGQLRNLSKKYEEGQREIKRSEQQFRELSNLIPQLVWVANPEGKLEWINENWVTFTGLTRDQLLGTPWNLGHLKAELTEEPIEVQFPIQGADGSQRWFLVRAVPVKDSTGQITFWFGTNTDIDDEHRERLVSETTSVLSQSLDLEIIAQTLATKLVPLLADWSAIVLFETDGSATQTKVTVTPGDAQKEDLTRFFLNAVLESPSPLSKELQSRKRVILNNLPLHLPEHQSLLQTISLGTLLVYPITIHKGIIGYVVFMFEDPKKRIGDSELTLYEKVQKKVSLHFENAFLHHQAKKAIEVRDEFISVASHELKTPLTSLTLQIQMINRSLRDERTQLSPDQILKSVDFCNQQVYRLTHLLNQLLDLTQIQRGQIQLQRSPSDLGFLAKQVLISFEEEVRRKQISLSLTSDEAVMGNWDATRLTQVISNLVSNALKYGKNGPVSVEVRKNSAKQLAHILVRDNGAGIPKEMKDKVFERFERGNSRLSTSGFGLGLYISRQITEAHGGKLSFESEVDIGSTFTVTLPL
jgi:PAS domain S-box-containing protein